MLVAERGVERIDCRLQFSQRVEVSRHHLFAHRQFVRERCRLARPHHPAMHHVLHRLGVRANGVGEIVPERQLRVGDFQLGLEEGKPAFGPISHLTNDAPEDVNLITMTAHSTHPLLQGKAQYFMKPNVPNRGAHYAVATVRSVLEHPDSPVHHLAQIDECMIHTGSKKILDGVCSQLALAPESAKVHGSYEVLKKYGNLSSASTGFMLSEKNEWNGPAMIVGFGVGFAASAGVMSLN